MAYTFASSGSVSARSVSNPADLGVGVAVDREVPVNAYAVAGLG